MISKTRSVMPTALAVNDLWKSYRLYHERNQYLKAAILKMRRSRYEEFWALKDVSLEVPKGKTFGLIGSNGSGKRTLLKSIAEILVPKGRASARWSGGGDARARIGLPPRVVRPGERLPQRFDPRPGRRRSPARFDDIVDSPASSDFIDQPVKNYSSGMYVRLGSP